MGNLEKVTIKIRFLRTRHSYFCVTTDLKYERIVYSANIYIYIYIYNYYNDNGIEVTVVVLANRNCTTCCQQETNAMFYLVERLII